MCANLPVKRWYYLKKIENKAKDHIIIPFRKNKVSMGLLL